jgi:hypothetical protein
VCATTIHAAAISAMIQPARIANGFEDGSARE